MDVETMRREGTPRSRTPFTILVAAAMDIALAAIPAVQLFREAPALRAVIWPDAIARTSLVLLPGVFAFVALLRRSRPALDAAIVLNVLVLTYTAPRSEFVVIPLAPAILLFLGRNRIPKEEGDRGARIAVGIAVVLSLIATVLLLSAPMRHVLWSTQTRAGRVVESHVQVEESCPQSLGGLIAPANDGGESGCDPVRIASRTEIAIALWGIALGVGLGGVVRHRTTGSQEAVAQ